MALPRVGKLVAITLLSVLVACVSLKDSDFQPVPHASNAVPELNWSPEAEGKNIGIGIGLVDPLYVTGKAEVETGKAEIGFKNVCIPKHPPVPCDPAAWKVGKGILDALPGALQHDIEEALLAKGFTITGRFPNLNSMTYAQKEKSILVLVPTMDFTVNSSDLSTVGVYWKHPLGSEDPEGQLRVYRLKSGQHEAFGNLKFEGTGQLSLSGKIYLEIMEPLTSQLLWKKQLDIAPQSDQFSFYYWQEDVTDKKGNVISIQRHLIPGYDTRGDALAKAVEAIYPELYKSFKTYFSKEEMAQVRLDADKLRKQKRY